jgi:hypothetical protein
MEECCAHHHRQRALHLLSLWPVRPQGHQLPREERYTTCFDSSETGFCLGCATQAHSGPTHGRLTHLTAEDAQNAPDMVYGMFLVHGSKALVLFDSSATCS